MRRGRWALLDMLRVVAGLAVILVGAAATSVAMGPARFVTFSGRSDVAALLMLAAGIALVVAGLTTSLVARATPAGDLAELVGLTWFTVPFIGWVEGPSVVRGLALFVSGLTLPLILHLLASLYGPTGRLVRTAVVIAYVEAAVVGVVLALFRDPYFDTNCFANCTTNPFLVHSAPDLVRALGNFDTWFLAGTGAFIAGMSMVAVAQSRGSARKRCLLVAVPGALFGVVAIARAVVGMVRQAQDPSDDVLFSLFVATACALLLVAAGLLGNATLRVRKRRALSRLVADLAGSATPGGLEAALGQSMGDPGLRLAYRVAGSSSLVDAQGRQVGNPGTVRRRRTTTLTRDSVPVAVVMHSGSWLRPGDQLGSAVLIGLENERLQAEVLVRLEQLRASRARIVEAGDYERRRLERDLHDGAQQSILALSYDVRLASAAAQAEGDTVTLSSMRRACELTEAVLQDLRELARGIFPTALVEVGLEASVRSYSDIAPVAVQVSVVDLDRQPGPVEAAAYFAVVEAVEDAAQRGATNVRVSMRSDHDRLSISVDDDGTPRTSPMTGMVDRVGAVGGTVTLDSTACRLEIPCE